MKDFYPKNTVVIQRSNARENAGEEQIRSTNKGSRYVEVVAKTSLTVPNSLSHPGPYIYFDVSYMNWLNTSYILACKPVVISQGVV